jgi:hypothetical protein
MNAKHLIVFLGGAIAIAWGSSCAPVNRPAGGEETAKFQAFPPTPPVPPPPPAETAPPIPAARSDVLQQRLEAAIAQVCAREMETTNAFWTIFHGILGLGPEGATLLNRGTGERVNAMNYICQGGEIRGLRFLPTKDGLDVQSGPPFVGQGHQDQFVAEMVQWGMRPERKFVVNGRDYVFNDFIRHSRARIQTRATPPQELSWAILVVGQSYGTDCQWTNSEGEKLHFEDVVRYELDASMDNAACGGTHRLFGLSWVYHLHLRRGGQKTGIWKEVAERTANHKRIARQLQNADGTFSSNFFRGPGITKDVQQRLNSTGHIFEWLALALTDEELNEEWVRSAAHALAMIFLEIQNQPMEGGTLYHAIHGVFMYYARVYGIEKLKSHVPHVVLLPGCSLKGM